MRRDIRQYNLWRDECIRLRACLKAIMDCQDAHCALCAQCLNALRPPVVDKEPPAITREDPVRTYKRTWPHRTAKEGR